jgi:hypothetical protein
MKVWGIIISLIALIILMVIGMAILFIQSSLSSLFRIEIVVLVLAAFVTGVVCGALLIMPFMVTRIIDKFQEELPLFWQEYTPKSR